MKNRILIVGIGLLAFGLANLLSYLPVSVVIAFQSRPFPFEHVHNVFPDHGGTHYEVGYIPIQEAINDPYWLVWSLVLYGGIGTIVFAIRRIRK